MKGLNSNLRFALAALLSIGTVAAASACSDVTSVNDVVEAPDTPELRAMLEATLVDEFRARAVYQRVIADFGAVMPFVNIEQAEQRHAEAILGLFANRGWVPPENPHDPASVESYASVAEACAVGVTAEIENADLYAEFLAQDLPFDVARVFSNNQRASLQNHLPAFQSCAGS